MYPKSTWQPQSLLTLAFCIFRLGDRTLTVSYAEPKQSEMNQDQVKSVYVGGLTATATKESLQGFFEGLDNIGEVKDLKFAALPVAGLWSCFGFIRFAFLTCRLSRSSSLAKRMTNHSQITALCTSKTEAVQSSWSRSVKPVRTPDGLNSHQSQALSSRYVPHTIWLQCQSRMPQGLLNNEEFRCFVQRSSWRQ